MMLLKEALELVEMFMVKGVSGFTAYKVTVNGNGEEGKYFLEVESTRFKTLTTITQRFYELKDLKNAIYL
jgi:hypothetical protein